VPGDIVVIRAGDRIPADLRVIEAHNLRVEEAILTGESTVVEKSTEALSGDLPSAIARTCCFPVPRSVPAVVKAWWWRPAAIPNWAISTR
jgi:magnesium-transporting ATPase (P-type)